MKKVIAVAISMAFLSGCAGSSKPETVKSTNGSAIEIVSGAALNDLNNNRVADNKLRLVTPADNTVGKGLAVLAVVTGNFSTSDFDKENYKGSAIDTMVNPTESYFTPKAKKSITEWMSANTSGYTYNQPLYIGHATWALIFNDSSVADPVYQLKYKVIFYKRPEGGSLFSAFTVADCSPTPVTATLAEWKENNYQKVTTETQKYMDSCLLEFNNQLPRLLKPANK
ncbi:MULTISPECIES: hypothetical protein [Enterobacterales]|uniref:hypothetical protein n=1 Tax=Enterobacterales TaxID=91347 RepID=UPI002ED8B6B8